MNHKSKYINGDMSPIPMPEDWQTKTRDEWRDIVTGFDGPKKLDIDYEDEENELQIQKTLEEDMFETEEDKQVEAEMKWDEHKEQCNGCALCEI